MRREKPEINAGSMADIAFLLLIFWLVATSIKPDRGIADVLESKDDKVQIAVPTKASDLIRVNVTEDGTYEFNGNEITLEDLERLAIRLIQRVGFKAKLVVTADYDAPYEEYMLLLRLADDLNIKTIENEVDEKTDTQTEVRDNDE